MRYAMLLTALQDSIILTPAYGSLNVNDRLFLFAGGRVLGFKSILDLLALNRCLLHHCLHPLFPEFIEPSGVFAA